MTKADLPERPSNVMLFRKSLPSGMEPPHNGGDGGDDDMERRVAKLESSVDAILAGIADIRTTQAKLLERMSGMNQRLDDAIKRVDRLPTQWDLAKIVFYVVGALMAAAIWGPRALALLGNAAQ